MESPVNPGRFNRPQTRMFDDLWDKLSDIRDTATGLKGFCDSQEDERGSWTAHLISRMAAEAQCFCDRATGEPGGES